jgi:hypothetical protein
MGIDGSKVAGRTKRKSTGSASAYKSSRQTQRKRN